MFNTTLLLKLNAQKIVLPLSTPNKILKRINEKIIPNERNNKISFTFVSLKSFSTKTFKKKNRF